MATIIARNGRWQAKVRRHGITMSETFASKSSAEAWARKIESEIERGLWRDSSEADRTSLSEALPRYEREKTKTKRSAIKEKSIIRVLLEEPIAKLALSRIRSSDCAAMVERWKRGKLAPATIKRRLNVLSHLFETARREWGMESLTNPVKLLKLPPVKDERDRRVSDEEIEALLSASGSSWLKAIVMLAVETAMRRSEIVGLTWANIDLRRRVAHLPETKNGDARDVPLSSRAVAILEDLPRNISGRVFDCRENSVTQAFERAAKRAGLKDLRFHDLRHEATSRLAERLQMHELAKVTGHKSPRMLMRYYHPRAEDLARKIG